MKLSVFVAEYFDIYLPNFTKICAAVPKIWLFALKSAILKVNSTAVARNRRYSIDCPEFRPDSGQVRQWWILLVSKLSGPESAGLSRLGNDVTTVPEAQSTAKERHWTEGSVTGIWNRLPQQSIQKAVVSFRKRLQACVATDGGHFEHLLS